MTEIRKPAAVKASLIACSGSPRTADRITGDLRDGPHRPEQGAKRFLSVRAVDNHLQNVYGKLGVASREELARVLR